jgi:superfamily II DNA or RNA helicase
VSFQATAKNLMMDEERTRVVIDKIRRATENEGRTVLVLGDSVDGLLYMSKMAREELPHLTHGVIVGKVPQNKRDAILQSNRVVWATTRLGYRGLDKPVADTVIAVSLVAVNVQFWRQVVGRVLRFIPDKPLPKVVIITDTTIGPVVALAAKLARIFKSEGWTRIGDAPLHEAQRKRREEKQYEQQSRGEEDDHF